MRNSHVLYNIAILTLLTIGFAWFGYADEPAPRTLPFVDVNDTTHTLESFAGEAVLLNLWATWCAPCVQEMPALNALQQAYAERGLRVITVSEDFKRDKAQAFFTANSLDALTLYFDVGSALLRALGTGSLPLSILYDAQGNKVERFSGAVEWEAEAVRKRIEAVLPAVEATPTPH